MTDDWKKSLPHLRQARTETHDGINNLKKALKALGDFMAGNKTAATNPARQKQSESIEKRLESARGDLVEIEKSIEKLEKDEGT